MNTCDCGHQALDNDHFCKECRRAFDDDVLAYRAGEARQQIIMQREITQQIHPAVYEAVIAAGGKFRNLYRNELLFPSEQLAEEWAAARGYQGGYYVRIIIVLLMPDGRKIGLITNADHARAQEQALAYMRAHSECEESRGTMFEAYEIGFLLN